jgi:alpha-ketoglutarate-dependent taurine dioxygenase
LSTASSVGTLLFDGLCEWATSEPRHHSHKSSVGDLAMWDNAGTLHRTMQLRRTTREGQSRPLARSMQLFTDHQQREP